MKHAFLILAHEQVHILNILLKMLDDSRNDLYLHLDLKSKIRPEKLYRPQKAAFFLLEERTDVRWGSFSIVEAELKLLRKAHAECRYSYLHVLSGIDLPIKSQDHIHDFF